MPISTAQIADYFRPPSPSVWSWQDDGQVLVWSDGATIAFSRELQPILSRLAQQGLPPFGAFVLLLAACRDNWSQSPAREAVIGDMLRELSGMPTGWLFHDVIRGLDEVHRLPREVRGTAAAKCEIAATIFEAAAARLPDVESSELARAFEYGLVGEQLEGASAQAGLTVLLGDLACLRDGLPRLDAKSLALRMQTGLEQQVQPAPIELDPATLVRNLIAQLEDDEELGGLARLARLLMAAVQLPRALADPDDLPLGGVSDISNRGALDRLLLSELAHDDLTLAVRVALNEALYLRRESPPRTPPRQRAVLLDSGIRMWGVPRVYAAAVGLALAATSEAQIEVAAFRAAGDDVEEVDFTTLDGLTGHLAALDHRAHPAEALSALADRLSENDEAADLVLITCEDVLADRDFQQTIADLPIDGFHVATVARDGRFRLLHRSRRGGKVLREASLALDDVLAPRPKRQLPLLDKVDPAWPAIFSVRPFPLRLSAPLNADEAWYVEGYGVLSYLHYGRLLLWTNPALGAKELATGLPLGKLHWCSRAAHDGKAAAVVGALRPDGLFSLQIDLERHEVRHYPLQLDGMKPDEVFCRQGVAFVLGERAGQAWVKINSLQTGELLASRPLPPMGPRRGGYFEHATAGKKMQWHVLAFDGVDLQTPVVCQRPVWDARILAVFDVHGVEGPVCLSEQGQLWFASSNEVRQVPHPLSKPVRLRGISRDGHRLLLTDHLQSSNVLIETLTGACRPANRSDHGMLDPQLGQFARPRNLRTKFQGIMLDPNRRLALVGHRQRVWPITLDCDQNKLVFPKFPDLLLVPGRVVPFEPIDTSGGVTLQMASWADGSRAWLDPRGLLHLRSWSSNVPQCTLVLAEREIAGWASDGSFWGAKYYLDDKLAMFAGEIYHKVIQPFIDRLP